MSIQQHPDFQQEQKRLKATQRYITAVLESTEGRRKTYKENIQKAMEELDYLDSSQSYINVLTNTKFLEMVEKSTGNLEKIQHDPYFCRIDFKFDGYADEEDVLYIGKTSLYRKDNHQPVIVDWRSPVATVYYEGRIGPTSYSTETQTVHGELLRKRQYTITDGKLKDFRDVDITARDELLQASLEDNVSTKLKDIVSTIQAEQNRVIRADMYRPLIVQGVAGSGKTTIALHRIAYFIYTYSETFDPDDFMIIAPNGLFLKYIADVLPELGVERVRQTTYVDFVSDCLGKRLKLTNVNEKLIQFIDHQRHEDRDQTELLKWTSAFKGSMTYKGLLSAYLNLLADEAVPKHDLMLEGHTVFTAERVRSLFQIDYRYLPFADRVKKIRKVLTNVLRMKSKEYFDQISNEFDDKMESARYKYAKEEGKRRQVIVGLMDQKGKLLLQLQVASRSLVSKYMKKFQTWDVLKCYLRLFEDETLKPLLLDAIGDEVQVNFLCTHTLELFHKKQIEFEDTAALLYLQHHLKGLDKEKKVKNVVIDEAQDFSPFQFDALKMILDTEMFTILGDVAQGIHSYRGIQNWEQLNQEVFSKLPCQMVTLEQSYRTTVEIMELANQVISQLAQPDIILAKPVVRHGDIPMWKLCSDDKSVVVETVERLISLKPKHESIAIICKSLTDCMSLHKALKKQSIAGDRIKQAKLSFTLLQEGDGLEPGAIHIVPSYLAKGLEFDAVVLVNLSEVYEAEELDLKLLYVAMTRPLHHLSIISKAGAFPVLDQISIEQI